VLAALRRAGAPYRLSPSRLLTQTLVTDDAMTHLLAHEHELLGALSPAERHDLAGLLRTLVAPLDEHE
jgi:hypothetical protein